MVSKVVKSWEGEGWGKFTRQEEQFAFVLTC